MKELKITKGELKNEGGGFAMNREEMEANADLIAEAFNVSNECDLMPRELLNQRNELREALRQSIQLVTAIKGKNFEDWIELKEWSKILEKTK